MEEMGLPNRCQINSHSFFNGLYRDIPMNEEDKSKIEISFTRSKYSFLFSCFLTLSGY